MNTVYKWIPYDYWQIKEYENWFKQQTKQGLEVQRIGTYWGKFKKVQPKDMEYRISLSKNPLWQDDMTDLKWQLVSRLGYVRLYKSAQAIQEDVLYKDRNEYVKDIVVYKEEREREVFWTYILLGIMVLSVAGLAYSAPYKRIILYSVARGISVLSFGVLVQLLVLYRETRCCKGLRCLCKKIEEGEFSPGAQTRKSTTQRCICMVLTVLIVLTGIMQLKYAWKDRYTLPEDVMGLPIVRLEMLHQDEKFLSDTGDDRRGDYYEYNRTLFAKRFYETHERGTVINEDGREEKCYIQNEFYELTFKNMINPLVEELIDRERYRDYYEVENNNLDKVYVFESYRRMTVIATCNNKVMCVDYSGEINVDHLLKEIVKNINK